MSWLPGFKLTDSVVPYTHVYVILNPKSSTPPHVLSEWMSNQRNLSKVWWDSIFIPALLSLPVTTRTRHFNIVRTAQITHILPSYVRLYDEDMVALDQALHAQREMDDFEWFFIVSAFGQRRLLREGEILGPEAFGFNEMFDLTKAIKVSIHIAMNFVCTDSTYSLFWHRQRTFGWIRCESFLCVITSFTL